MCKPQIIEKNLNKHLLENGDVVVLKDGIQFVVLKGYLMNNNSKISLFDYNSDLTHKEIESKDVYMIQKFFKEYKGINNVFSGDMYQNTADVVIKNYEFNWDTLKEDDVIEIEWKGKYVSDIERYHFHKMEKYSDNTFVIIIHKEGKSSKTNIDKRYEYVEFDEFGKSFMEGKKVVVKIV